MPCRAFHDRARRAGAASDTYRVSGQSGDTSRAWAWQAQGLTRRESEVLALIGQGRSNRDIATALFLTDNTVRSYIRNAYRKIGARRRTQAVLWVIQHGPS